MPSRILSALIVTSLVATSVCADEGKPEKESTAEKPTATVSDNKSNSKKLVVKRLPTPPKKLFTGKVVMLVEALAQRGITAYNEHEKQVALETPEGELIPIVADWRGRAFYQDKRLRDRKVDLVGYRRKGVPYLQVLMIFTYNKKGQREYMDYWCDICSIPMYEIKPCDCCQDDIRLRFQPRPLPSYLDLKLSTEEKKAANTTKKSDENKSSTNTVDGNP